MAVFPGPLTKVDMPPLSILLWRTLKQPLVCLYYKYSSASIVVIPKLVYFLRIAFLKWNYRWKYILKLLFPNIFLNSFPKGIYYFTLHWEYMRIIILLRAEQAASKTILLLFVLILFPASLNIFTSAELIYIFCVFIWFLIFVSFLINGLIFSSPSLNHFPHLYCFAQAPMIHSATG